MKYSTPGNYFYRVVKVQCSTSLITKCSHTDQSKHKWKSKHETETQTLNLTHLRLCWKSAQKVAEKMEKLSHLHKYQQPCALAISEAWLDDRAPDGRVVSGCSRAFTMDRELFAMGEHSGSGVCCPIRDQWCKSAMAIEMLHSHQNAFLVAQLFCPRNPFIFLHSSCRQIHYFLFQIQSLGQTVQTVICK